MSKVSHFSHLFIYLSRRSIFHVLLFSSIAATFSILNDRRHIELFKKKISNQMRLMNKLDWFSFCWWKFFVHVQRFSFLSPWIFFSFHSFRFVSMQPYVCVCVCLVLQMKINLIKPYWFVIAGCYTSEDEKLCVKTNNASDEIFWNRTCTSVKSICAPLSAINASYCQNDTSQELVPMQKIIKRVLASEEYY